MKHLLRYLTILIFLFVPLLVHGIDTEKLWKSVPEKLQERYNEASRHVNEDWVLTVADSLEKQAKVSGNDALYYFAYELRCNNAYYNKDSLKFITNSQKAREWAKNLNLESLYYSNMMNVVTFYMNIHHKHLAQKASQEILEEAKKNQNNGGMYCGYNALGIVFLEKSDFQRAIDNFKRAIEYLDRIEGASQAAKSQVLGYIATCYLKQENFESAIEYAKMALELNPNDEEIEVVLAQSYFMTDNYMGFYEVFNQMKAQTSFETAIYKHFYHVLEILDLVIKKDYDEALKELEGIDNKSERLLMTSEIYKKMNKWETAYHYRHLYEQFEDSVSQVLYDEELAEISQEMDMIHEINIRDERLMRQKYLLIIAGILTFIAIIACVLVYVRYVNTKKKNKAMANNMNQLIKYKNKILELENEKYSKDQPLITEKTATDGELKQENKKENGLTEAENSEIERFIYELTSRKLFTDHEFNRDTLIDELHMQKRTFTKTFEAYTGQSFKEYITGLRLEYATQLIKEHPEYTIEAIAMECGITSYVTFHRNFTRYFGIAPSTYRSQM